MANTDQVDTLIEQWRRERPDLDGELDAMATIGRLGRLVTLVGAEIDTVFAQHGLTVADFDVLSALRRAGAPYVLRPTDLSRQLMLSPAGMTGRLDRLDGAGLVERSPDPDDRRSWLIRLSDRGRSVVDAAVTDHVANETRILAALTAAQRRSLDDVVRTLLRHLDPPNPPAPR
jgi:DNA-binding MarR family transcriptional regulator